MLKDKLMKLVATRFEMSTQDYVDKILDLIREEVPVKQTHWIQHGDIGHPHETEYDNGWNACRKELLSKLGEK